MSFMDNNFLLNTESAKELYKVAEKQPISDFHCHLDPKEIFEDKPFDNIVDVWLGGDHYKWRLMRANGVAEKYITGDASNEEKFKAWAETIGKAIGNPLYHWTHLEMSRVFGIYEPLNANNWKTIYDKMNEVIKERQMSPRQLIEASNVEFIGTTDHPLDDLEWHQKIKQDDSFDTVVAPTFRPDEAFVSHGNFSGFVSDLSKKVSEDITNYDSFMNAMEQRIAYFKEHGAKASDHSIATITFERASKEELDAIFDKANNKEALTAKEQDQWQTEVLKELNALYKQYGLTAQIHFGALRNNNTAMFELTGADAGFDSMGDQVSLGENLNQFLDYLNSEQALPKMIWYNLNPQYNTIVANAIHNFQANEEGIAGKLQFGAAWWFADTKLGMINQMEVLADHGILANFVGMLTDSRSFLSYQRHEYFRRILAAFIGEWVENEEVPNDKELLYPIIEDICYNNAMKIFN